MKSQHSFETSLCITDTALHPGGLDSALIPLRGKQVSQVVTDITPSVTVALVFWLIMLLKIKLERT